MRLNFWRILPLVILAGCIHPAAQRISVVLKSETPSSETAEKGYLGPAVCSDCHLDIYNSYRATAHPFKIRPAREAHTVGMALPEGYSWNDISYVIGGRRWKSRYMNTEGYIVTMTGENRDVPGKNQYNIATGEWVDYHPGETMPYDCGRCHTTGYSETGHQDGLEGIVGSWAFPGITCEECHGPGKEHVESKGQGKILKDTSSSACGKCHVRGDKSKIPAGKGFIQHHEQYNELLAGSHAFLDCVACHNPHKPLQSGIKSDCSDCHRDVAAEFAGSRMEKLGKTCEDCHMPTAAKSAVSTARWQGDVKSHLFKINIDPDAKMFTDDGMWAKGYLTLEFACLKCHMDQSAEWAAGHAKEAHTIGK